MIMRFMIAPLRRTRAVPKLPGNRAIVLTVAVATLAVSIGSVLRGQAPASQPTFTQAQATEGGAVYMQQCASCHGARLDDGAGAAAHRASGSSTPGPRPDARWTISSSSSVRPCRRTRRDVDAPPHYAAVRRAHARAKRLIRPAIARFHRAVRCWRRFA